VKHSLRLYIENRVILDGTELSTWYMGCKYVPLLLACLCLSWSNYNLGKICGEKNALIISHLNLLPAQKNFAIKHHLQQKNLGLNYLMANFQHWL